MKNPSRLPRYRNKPIRTLPALAAALGMSAEELVAVSAIASKLYRNARPTKKADGSIRQPVDALRRLKRIHRKIKDRLLREVEYPVFLTGSIRGRSVRHNAVLHQGATIVVSEDITGFFPSTTAECIFRVWTGCLGFSEEVAQLLTALTTKDGFLPEGAATSSYLANLVFWDCEERLHDQLQAFGVTYSRYVDDIAMSSRVAISPTRLTECIAQVYGMFRSRGYSAKRGKHEIARGHGPMMVTKLLVNKRPAIPRRERDAIRAAVFQLERQALHASGLPDDFNSQLNSIAGRVTRLAQFHAPEGEALKKRVRELRNIFTTAYSE